MITRKADLLLRHCETAACSRLRRVVLVAGVHHLATSPATRILLSWIDEGLLLVRLHRVATHGRRSHVGTTIRILGIWVRIVALRSIRSETRRRLLHVRRSIWSLTETTTAVRTSNEVATRLRRPTPSTTVSATISTTTLSLKVGQFPLQCRIPSFKHRDRSRARWGSFSRRCG